MFYSFSPYIFVELSTVRVRKSLLSWIAIQYGDSGSSIIQLHAIELNLSVFKVYISGPDLPT